MGAFFGDLLDGTEGYKVPIDRNITDKNPFSSEWTFYPENDGTFEAMGNSGSPIVSGLTGKVIGDFLSADDGFEATFGGFEELRLP